MSSVPTLLTWIVELRPRQVQCSISSLIEEQVCRKLNKKVKKVNYWIVTVAYCVVTRVIIDFHCVCLAQLSDFAS